MNSGELIKFTPEKSDINTSELIHSLIDKYSKYIVLSNSKEIQNLFTFFVADLQMILTLLEADSDINYRDLIRIKGDYSQLRDHLDEDDIQILDSVLMSLNSKVIEFNEYKRQYPEDSSQIAA